jgi:hypothetical protein
MNPPGPTAKSDSLLRQLAENNDESATVAMLTELCRESSELRHWLWEDFGRDAKVRTKFAEIVDSAASPPIGAFIELTNDAGPWQKERDNLRKQISSAHYGGLKRSEIMQLIRRYQAGTVDLGVFLLAHDWRKAGKASPLLKWAGTEFLEQVIPSGRRRLLKHLNKALAFLKSYENKAKRRSVLGYANRWKLLVLFYMLQHPHESYGTRELRAHLVTRGLQISIRDLQRFSVRHGIRRDMSAGRPRKRIKPTC